MAREKETNVKIIIKELDDTKKNQGELKIMLLMVNTRLKILLDAKVLKERRNEQELDRGIDAAAEVINDVLIQSAEFQKKMHQWSKCEEKGSK